MNLLIVTQKVDKNDGVLGFFHAWIEEFAKHYENITVICLQKGECDLPENVQVLSLGKEEGSSRLKYFFRFYRYIWRERGNYDSVFVHMNKEYVLLGGLFWRAWGKKVTLWSNHKKGNVLTTIAVWLSDAVFCTSKFSYTAQFKKTKIMPVGVDTELFKKNISAERRENSILCIGRISPIKNVDVLIDAAVELDKSGNDFMLTLVGDSLPKDAEYAAMIKTKAIPLLEKGKIQFLGSVPNDKTPKIYNRHEIYVNLTDSGSFDKTILEAMACECIPIASNALLKDILTERFLFKEKNAADLAKKLQAALSLSENEKEAYRKTFRQYALTHDISRLAKQLFDIMGK